MSRASTARPAAPGWAAHLQAVTGAIGGELQHRLPPIHLHEPIRQPSDRDRTAAMTDGNDSLAMAKDEPVLTRMFVAIATLTERQSGLIRTVDANRAADEDFRKELMGRLGEFVPRAEIQARNVAVDHRLDEIEKRVDKADLRMDEAEGRVRKTLWWGVTTLGGIVAGGLGLHFKGG